MLGWFLSETPKSQGTPLNLTRLSGTSHPDPLAELAYHGVYNIYANFTSPDDVQGFMQMCWLSTPMMGIEAPVDV